MEMSPIAITMTDDEDINVRSRCRVLIVLAQRLCSGELWRAYTDSVRVWFVIARAVDVWSKDPPTIALELLFFDNDGTICAAGVWGRHGDCDWTLHDVLARSRSPLDAGNPPSKRVKVVPNAGLPEKVRVSRSICAMQVVLDRRICATLDEQFHH